MTQPTVIRIETGSFGPWETNAYIVWDGRSTDALVVDPGMGAAAALMERAAANGLSLHLIANSHGHIDHIFDDAPLMDASQAPLAIHPDDAYRLDGRNNYGFDLRPVTATRDLVEGEQVRIGDLVFDVLHTPGHSEGSVCLYEERQAPADRRRRPLRRQLWPDRSPRRQRRADGGIARAPRARDSTAGPRPAGARCRNDASNESCPGCDGSRSPDGSFPDSRWGLCAALA